MNPKYRPVLWGGAVGVPLVIAVACFAPAAPLWLQERRLAGKVREFSSAKTLASLSDDKLRSRIQTLARAEGFYLGFEDIVLVYGTDKKQSFEVPKQVGYTLGINVPLFGIFTTRMLAVRQFDVP